MHTQVAKCFTIGHITHHLAMGAISRLAPVADDLRDIVEMLCNAAMFVAATVAIGGVVITWMLTRNQPRLPVPPAPETPPGPACQAVVLWVFLADSKDESIAQMEEEIVPAMPFHVVYMSCTSIGKLYNPGPPLPPEEFEVIRQQAIAVATKVLSFDTTKIDTISHMFKQFAGDPDIPAWCKNVLGVHPKQGAIKTKHFDRVLQWNGLFAMVFKHPNCAALRALAPGLNRQRLAVTVCRALTY